ncbi:uncharacterized protein Dana_GF14567 [Drosophila ananassae]|uniref:Uncharacterized protein n=1 Tax=Drosophila ananassae TaxID=7217 RepID=B3MJR4_DROAN|nr:COPII coat assembly protein SEC16 [Drosophila ananassae]EDV31403.1 uncharacterized protein Dana_GF14567 [Drosophila ananassae]
MFPDEFDNQPFDPFNVGPPNSGLRLEYNIPTCCSYPPPVFVAKPEYVKAAEDQKALLTGSQASFSRDSKLKVGKSRIGEVAISKAINEEMSLAKKQAAAIHEKARIDAGGESKVNVSIDSTSDERVSAKDSVRTLLPVKSKRQTSGGGGAQSSGSDSSVAQKTSKVSQVSSKPSRVSQADSTTVSNTTLSPKSILKKPIKFKDAVEMSSISIKSKPSAREYLRPRPSERSTRSHTSQKNVDESASTATIRKSITSTASLKQEKENASKASIKSKTNDAPSRIGLKENANKVQSHSDFSFGKSLTEQVADLADRLNAGNEPNFRRYDSVVRNHSVSEPKKLNHGDRMTFWFSDAVLS